MKLEVVKGVQCKVRFLFCLINNNNCSEYTSHCILHYCLLNLLDFSCHLCLAAQETTDTVYQVAMEPPLSRRPCPSFLRGNVAPTTPVPGLPALESQLPP